MNYLVNGTSSIVGNSICKLLIEKKMKVFCFYNKVKPKNLKSKYSILKKNNFKNDYKINGKIDCLIFCAIDKKNNYINNNISFFKKTLKFILKKKIKKVIFISTMAVYGQPKTRIVNEKTKTSKTTNYASIKLKQENLLKKFIKNYQCQITILRLPGVVGRNSNKNFLSQIALSIKKNKMITFGNPESYFNNLIFSEDLAKIIFKISKNNKKYKYNVYNLGSSKPEKLGKIVNIICRFFRFKNKVVIRKTHKSFYINIKKFEKDYFKLNTTLSSLNKFNKSNSK